MLKLMASLYIGTIAAFCLVSFYADGQAKSSALTNSIHSERFGAGPALPVLILLHGVNGPSLFYREQAAFFAKHGYRVIMPHYLDAGHGQTATDENYAAWIAAVREIIDNSQIGHACPTVVIGYSLGASIALALGSQGLGPDAIAEFYGSLPDRYFRDLKGMPPLLILHGNQDVRIPVSNALQLSQLCSQAELNCEMHIYPNEGHGFTPEALRDADQRTLQFFSQMLKTVAHSYPC